MEDSGLVDRQPEDRRSALREIAGWGRRYLRTHPLLSLDTVGGQLQLAARTIQYFFVDLFTGKFQWQEFVRQAAFMAGTSFIPTVFVTIPLGVTLAIQFSVIAGQIGATSLAGAATGMFTIRQGASLTSALLLASAVGSAVCADLGARTMREEIDAMEVMGVSPIRRLVVPRFAAVILIGLALTGWTCFVGFLAGYIFNVYMQNGTPGSFLDTYSAFVIPGDFVLAFAKSVIFGAIVAIVASHKGLNTRGGPAGVANSVNAAVVESILLLMTVNVVLTQLYILIFPRATL
ncbi:MlaE family ABC transporter permease [Mycobacterium sp. MAA66]|uniref:MlaE family ABC transporter permease n=1 Tax=Mycobacterium sp. MAA66 TaxID=3156297 RepID=UPI0035136326